MVMVPSTMAEETRFLDCSMDRGHAAQPRLWLALAGSARAFEKLNYESQSGARLSDH